jgi:putative phosphoesterase
MMLPILVGVVSDTHGLLRPEVKSRLRACAEILHTGDFEDPWAFTILGSIAKITAVRGNCDRNSPLPLTQIVTIAGQKVYLIHDLSQMNLDPVAAGINVVVSGHTHRPHSEVRDGILYFNPGSAGPLRFNKPISMGRLTFYEDHIIPELITLVE